MGQLKIGRMTVPDVRFPDDFSQLLQEYLRSTGDTLGYVAQIGVEHPLPADIDEDTFHVYATYEFLKSEPENGLAAIYVAQTFDSIGARQPFERQGPVLAHLATVQHELENYDGVSKST